MNRIARALVLSGCLALGSGILMAGTPCGPVTLTVGGASNNGRVQFTLVGSDAALYTVQVSVSAGDTAAVVASKISQAVNNNLWKAQVNPDNSMGFQHLVQGAWVNVFTVSGVQDTAGASLKVSTYLEKSYAEIQLTGAPTSHFGWMTFSVPGESAPLNVGFYQGETASQVVDSIAAYLNSAGPGVAYTRISPTRIGLHLSYVNSWVTFQTNDPNVQGTWTQSTQVLDCSSVTGLIQN